MSETVDNLILDLLEWDRPRRAPVPGDDGGVADLVPAPAGLGGRDGSGLHRAPPPAGWAGALVSVVSHWRRSPEAAPAPVSVTMPRWIPMPCAHGSITGSKRTNSAASRSSGATAAPSSRTPAASPLRPRCPDHERDPVRGRLGHEDGHRDYGAPARRSGGLRLDQPLIEVLPPEHRTMAMTAEHTLHHLLVQHLGPPELPRRRGPDVGLVRWGSGSDPGEQGPAAGRHAAPLRRPARQRPPGENTCTPTRTSSSRASSSRPRPAGRSTRWRPTRSFGRPA